MITPKITNPSGKRGATRVPRERDEIIHVPMEICLNCSHEIETPIRTEKKTIFDIPPPQKIKVMEY